MQQQLIYVADEPILQTLQRPCADLTAWLSTLNRHRNRHERLNRSGRNAPSRTHIPTRQPHPPVRGSARPAAHSQPLCGRPRDGSSSRTATIGSPAQTTPPHGAMQRGRRRRGNLEDHPALANRYVCREVAVSVPWSGKFAEPLNLLHSVQTYMLPGTLHHSGNRPAPPSEHTPLERRSAFWPLISRDQVRTASHAARTPSLANSNKRDGVQFVKRDHFRWCGPALAAVKAYY